MTAKPAYQLRWLLLLLQILISHCCEAIPAADRCVRVQLMLMIVRDCYNCAAVRVGLSSLVPLAEARYHRVSNCP
eukprot:scaffold181261_cov32-Prasinocladus_malaysianus.AAC.1